MVDNTTADLDFGTVMSDEELAASLEAETTPTEEPKQESTPEDDPLAPEQIEETPDENDEEVDIPADEQEESNALKLKPKKKTAQERIDELTAARRAAEREAEDLRRQLAERSQPKEVETKEAVEAPAGPTPDDVDANGEAKYPLGEFDPGFIRDHLS